MKTSNWILIGVAAYLYYQYSQSHQPVVFGPPAPPMGPPLPINDPCNGISPVFNPDQCAQAGRLPYYPLD